MGYSTEAVYGIGCKISLPEDAILDDKFDDGIEDYLDEHCDIPKDLFLMIVGDPEDGDVEYFLCLHPSLVNSNTDLTDVYANIDIFTKSSLLVASDFGLHGGLFIR